MKHAIARPLAALLALALLASNALAGEETVTHRGIIYKKVSENQLTIIDFTGSKEHVGVYEIARHVTIGR